MILFDNKINQTLVDIKGETSMLIHSINGCNLKCHKCHNYEEIVNFKGKPLTGDEIIEKIKISNNMYDNLILSGGEFMKNKPDKIINFIKDVKEVFNGKIVIYTNGFYYKHIKEVFNEGIVDDWYMDIKFPYNLEVDEQDKNIYEEIVGIEYNKYHIESVMNSINILKDHNFRTVQYPQYNEKLYKGILKMVDEYNLKHTFNEFVEL